MNTNQASPFEPKEPTTDDQIPAETKSAGIRRANNNDDDDESPSSFDVKMENNQEEQASNAVNDKTEEEIYRLAGRKPLITICHLMVGPIISQVTGALYGIINSIWISKKIGEKGLSAISTEITLEGIGRAFGYFLMIAGSTKISQLFGQKKFEEATQVACDLLRCTIICGIIVPVCILPSHKALCKWYGASEETTRLGFQYITPLCACSVLTCINLCCQGFLQAEGRTMLIGLIDLVSLIVACFGICPLLLFGLNCGMCSASVSTVCADAVPGIVLTVLYFKGKFGIRPKGKQLLKPFSKNTWPALIVGLSQLISNLSGSIPGIPIRNLIGKSCADSEEYDRAMAGFNVQNRVYLVSTCICIAVTTGFIPPASYAHASNNDRRFLRLSFHACWINFAWCVLITILAFSIPKQISLIFGHGEEFLHYAIPMLKNSNYTCFLRWIQFNSQAMLQALQRGWQAMVVSLLSNFAGFLIFAYVFYYTDKHNVIRLMYLYSATTGFGAVVGICLLIHPLLKLYKKSKIQRAQMENNDVSQNDNVDDGVKLKSIQKASSVSVMSKKIKLKEIKKASSKFESRYMDLDSTVNSNISLSPVDYETKDKSSKDAEIEAKSIPEY